MIVGASEVPVGFKLSMPKCPRTPAVNKSTQEGEETGVGQTHKVWTCNTRTKKPRSYAVYNAAPERTPTAESSMGREMPSFHQKTAPNTQSRTQ